MSDCCSCWKPLWKRRVDAIFPRHPNDSINHNNMEKLNFYIMAKPGKVERIGEYLRGRLVRILARLPKQQGYVYCAMTAMDQMLKVGHAHQFGSFTQSFLSMIELLLSLTANDADLLILGCDAFERFSHIQEETQVLMRNFDFLVERFASLSYTAHPDEGCQRKLRVAGIKGIQGVVRKVYSNSLQQAVVWKPEQMGLIVSALMWNLKEKFCADDVIADEDQGNSSSRLKNRLDDSHPAVVAETVFQDLITQADSATLELIVKPVLAHLDHKDNDRHNWLDEWLVLKQIDQMPNLKAEWLDGQWPQKDTFPTKVFQMIIFSCKAQFDFFVVQMLMSHLDLNIASPCSIKAAIVKVMLTTVVFAASEAVGPSVLEVFHVMLKHLKYSMEQHPRSKDEANDEKIFQDTIIVFIVQFAAKLPDYQKLEIISFIASKVPTASNGSEADERSVSVLSKHQFWLLNAILEISAIYQGKLLATTLPDSLLKVLFHLDCDVSPTVRPRVQKILAVLLDRKGCRQAFERVALVEDLTERLADMLPARKGDVEQNFANKFRAHIYQYLFASLLDDKCGAENYEAIYMLIGVMSVQLCCQSVLVDLLCLMWRIQEEALGARAVTRRLPMPHICAIHALVATINLFLAQLLEAPQLKQYVLQVASRRSEQAEFLLPEFAFNRRNKTTSYPPLTQFADVPSDMYFDGAVLARLVSEDGASALADEMARYRLQQLGSGARDGDMFEALAVGKEGEVSRSVSLSDVSVCSGEIESRTGSTMGFSSRRGSAQPARALPVQDTTDSTVQGYTVTEDDFCIDLSLVKADSHVRVALEQRANRGFDELFADSMLVYKEREAASSKWRALAYGPGVQAAPPKVC